MMKKILISLVFLTIISVENGSAQEAKSVTFFNPVVNTNYHHYNIVFDKNKLGGGYDIDKMLETFKSWNTIMSVTIDMQKNTAMIVAEKIVTIDKINDELIINKLAMTAFEDKYFVDKQ